MKIKSIKLDDDEMPSNITVSLSIEEAVWIAKVSGKQRGESPHNEIYNALTGSVFNPFWDDGIDEAYRQHPVKTPIA